MIDDMPTYRQSCARCINGKILRILATVSEAEVKISRLGLILCFLTTGLVDAQTVCCDAVKLRKTVENLSGPAMQGRGPTTAGLKASGTYIQAKFKIIGLKGGLPEGRFFQDFEYTPPSSKNPLQLSNVVGVLDAAGSAQETIVIGAHYDHLGYGPAFSMAQGAQRNALHPGADDNASGVAVLLEAARYFAAEKSRLKKRIVFVAFSGEEEGELGSKHYVQNPVVPLADTVAMINLDMVGRVRDGVLGIAGDRSGNTFDDVLDRASANSKLKVMRGGEEYPDDSDHAPFAAAGIPILYLCSGSHNDRHTPGDTANKINVTGMAEVTELVIEIIEELAKSPRPLFVARPK